jgi:hypothetical protein
MSCRKAYRSEGDVLYRRSKVRVSPLKWLGELKFEEAGSGWA